jgi:fused signal recognition particle receptor
MFNFIKNKLSTIYSSFTSKVSTLFSRTTIDEETLKELEQLLLSADAGVTTTRTVLTRLRKSVQEGSIEHGQDLKKALEKLLIEHLEVQKFTTENQVFLLVGINGSGKTTFVGKLANQFVKQGKKVLLVAGDTFRAAATAQLKEWATRIHADIIIGKENQDPASVIFTACQQFKNNGYDVLIIDTAGRLQTKTNLMKELEKIRRILSQQLPEKKITTLLTIDSMLGQNSFEQAKLFNESTSLDGIILTKMDGTAKGGIVFAIAQELHIPIAYISHGEGVEQFDVFDAQNYVKQLLES